MKLVFKLQAQAAPIFRQMAQDAGVSVNDMGEIACYALMASWQAQHGQRSTEGAVEFSDTPPHARLPNS